MTIDLRERLTSAVDLVGHDPEHPEWNRAHGEHRYDGGCAICRGDSSKIAAELAPVVESLLREQRRATAAAIRAEAHRIHPGIPSPVISVDVAAHIAMRIEL